MPNQLSEISDFFSSNQIRKKKEQMVGIPLTPLTPYFYKNYRENQT